MGNSRSRRRRKALAVLFVVGALSHPSAHGQVARSSLTLDDAIARALAANPGLRAAGYGVEIAGAQRDGAMLATPFAIEAEIENFAGTDSLESFDAAETTLQLSKVLEQGDKRQLRTELGDARVMLAETERAIARLDLAAEVTRRFVRVIVAQQRLRLAEQVVEVARTTGDVVRRRFEVGRSSEAELATAEIALAQAEFERTTFERRLESDRVGLATLWAEPRPDFGTAQGDLFDLPVTTPLEAVERRIAQSPDLLRLVGEQRILDAEQRLAESRRRADLAFAFGLRHLASADDTGFTVSVSMPVGNRSRAAPSIAEASARRARLPETIAQRRLDLLAVLFELYQEMDLARERRVMLAETLVPRGERAVELYARGFELGSYSLLELNEAQRELLALRRNALTAAADFHLTLLEIERLLGGIDPTGERP